VQAYENRHHLEFATAFAMCDKESFPKKITGTKTSGPKPQTKRVGPGEGVSRKKQVVPQK